MSIPPDRFKGIRRDFSPEDVNRLRGTVHVEHSLARLGAERLWQLLTRAALRPRARRGHRQPGDAAGQGRARGDLPVRLAGRRRRQQCRRDVPRPVALPVLLGPRGRPPHQQDASARRPDRAARGQRRDLLVRADHRRRRSRVRRAAQRVRADEGDDRGGRRRPSTSRTSSRRRRSAAISAARCWCRPGPSSAPSTRRGSRPTSAASTRCSSPAPTRIRRR